MGKIKKKGKYLWGFEELHQSHSSSTEAANLTTGLQTIVHSLSGAERLLELFQPKAERYRGHDILIDLTVFKGIFPREPRNKKKVTKSATPSTTFYYTRDIQYLLHEPLLAKFRDHKALGKKIARHLGRGEAGDAQRLEQKSGTKLSLDHIVKERYPTFADALRDLDDCLSLLFLFANLPSTSTVPSKTISLCQRLCREFEHYVIATNSLRKSFLSIRGIYYQATIQGQDILWLVPYKFVQRVSQDVDFRIMSSFAQFYTTLLGFVNFRLYTSIGLVYPPRFNAKSDEQGGELTAFTLEGTAIQEPQHIEASTDINDVSKANEEAQKQIAAIEEVADPDEDPEPREDNTAIEPSNEAIDTFEAIAEDADILPQPQASSNDAASLLAPFTFFLSRETPKQSLEFILRAFGCKRIGWDAVLGDGAFTNNESDPTITHQIVDRPPLASVSDAQDANDSSEASSTQVVKPGYRVPGRIYVQPQWVWDTINQVKLLRPDLYAPGVTMPPHLSPFVRPTKGSYDPTAPLADQEREGEAEEAAELEQLEEEEDESENSEDSDAEIAEKPTLNSNKKKSATATKQAIDPHGMTIAEDSDSSSSSTTSAPSFTGFDDPLTAPSDSDENSPSHSRSLHQAELEAEAAGLSFSEIPISTTLSESHTQKKANGVPVKGILKAGGGGNGGAKDRAKKRREEDEELERRKMMMGRKKRKVLEKMLYSNKQKEEEAERLRGKRRRIEGGKGRGG